MKVLVVYDSAYGNTAKVAKAIVDALPEGKLEQATGVGPGDLEGLDLLVVGSPTQGGRPTTGAKGFLDAIPSSALRGVDVAAFDTRFSAQDQNPALRLLMKVIGYAAGRIASALQAKGGRLVTVPEGFVVEAKEGPLREGELERAAAWARKLRENAS